MIHDSTVDPREVDYYTELADTWWDTQGPFWPLHRLNELRVAYIRDMLVSHFDLDANTERPLAGLNILDVGCGGGILSESMAKLGATVTGIDIVERNIGVATLHAQQQDLPIEYRLTTADKVAATGSTFDVVLNMEVVEHVADVDAFMHDCTQLTRPGGLMFVATINRNPLSWLVAIVGAEYILRWLPRGTHRWSEFRKPGEIARLLRRDGFTIEDARGVAVNPLTRSMRLIGSLAVNYMLVASRRSD